MLKLITLAIISLSSIALAKSPATYSQLKGRIQNIPQKSISSWVSNLLSESAPSRMVGMPGHEKAKNYLLSTIAKLDPKNTGKLSAVSFEADVDEAKRFYQKDFDDKVVGKIPTSSPNYRRFQTFTNYMKEKAQELKINKGENIIWEKSGINTNKVLVITAHYDTVSQDPDSLMINTKSPMPGANYNASGVAVALGIINLLAEFDLNYSVQVVFLDWQGIGFLGSFHHARTLQQSGKDVMGVINLEMLGQDSTFFDKTKKIGNMSVYLRKNVDEENLVKKMATAGTQMTKKVTFEAKPIGFENSDNIRYQELAFPTITYSQNWEDDFNPKFFQTAQDTPETLNHETLYASYEFIAGGVAATLLDIIK
jgi:hypothetical protein